MIASRSAYAVPARSGLPKLRQFVIAAGSAPLQATFSTACATASRAAAAGIERHAGAVAVERDRDRALDGRQPHDRGIAARARITVPEPTSWSYCA